MAEKDVFIAEKYQTFNSFVSGTPMITLNKLTRSENYQSWANSVDLWFIGNGCEDLLLLRTQVFLKINVLNGKKLMLYFTIFFNNTLYNIGAYKTCYTVWNQIKKLYTNDIQRLYRVISPIANLKQLGMDISSYGGRMSALKDELISILPKSTNTETSLSKMDLVFMIILLLNLGPDFENIREQILTGAVIPNFDEVLAWLLRHTSTATQSMRSEITLDTFVMVSQSHSRSDSKGGRGSNRGREDNVLNAHTVIGLDTPVIDAISYMAELLVLLIWLNLLIIQHVRVLSQGAHRHLKGSFLRPTNMRSTFVSLKQPNLPPLLLLPRPVMSLLALHIHLYLGSLILEPLIISLIIKTFFLLLPFRLLYLQLS